MGALIDDTLEGKVGFRPLSKCKGTYKSILIKMGVPRLMNFLKD